MTRPAAPDYFRTVERTFLDLRGGLTLTPADWDVVSRWEKRGIPLEVVLSGIRAAFSGRTRVSARMPLGECTREVEAAFDAKRLRKAGAAVPPRPEAGTGNDPDRLVDRLREWSPERGPVVNPGTAGDLVTAARQAAARMERLGAAPGASADTAKALKAIQKDLLARFAAALSAEAREEIESEVRQKLAPYRARMPESTWRETFEQAVRRRVEQVFGLGPPARLD